MAKSADIKVKISSDGGTQAAADISKVEKAAGDASSGGLSKLADKIKGDVSSALDKIPGGSDLASGGISGLGLAAGAGATALVGFAAKGVMAFEDTTLAVGKFRDATGTTSEEASRFTEVFNDLGIGADAGSAAIGKMEKALGANAQAFQKYGVDVVKAKDGTIDAQGTFENAVDALNKIEDPAKRAAAGAAIFGKGWSSMAEIIASGSGPLKQALDSVQPSKVFSDKDIKSGRDLRDAFDQIRDAGEGLLLTIGRTLAPVISSLAPVIGHVIDAVGPLVQAIGENLADALKSALPLLETFGKVAGPAAKGLSLLAQSTKDWAHGIKEATSSSGDADIKAELDKQDRGAVKLTASLSDNVAALRDWAGEATDAGEPIATLSQATADYNETLANLPDSIAAAAAVTKQQADNDSELTANINGVNTALQEQVAQLRDTAKGYEDTLAAQKALIDNSENAADSARAEKEAYDAFGKVLKDNKATSKDAADAAITLAKAHEKAADDAAAAAGQTRTQTESIDSFNKSLLDTASASPKARAELVDYIATLNGIPPEKASEIKALLDQGKVDEANRVLADASRTRDVAIDADTSKFNADVANAKADAAKPVTVPVVYTGRSDQRIGARASGGPVTAGEAYIVGENRPELFVPDQNGTILPSVPSGGGSGDTYVFQMPHGYSDPHNWAITRKQLVKRGYRDD